MFKIISLSLSLSPIRSGAAHPPERHQGRRSRRREGGGEGHQWDLRRDGVPRPDGHLRVPGWKGGKVIEEEKRRNRGTKEERRGNKGRETKARD